MAARTSWHARQSHAVTPVTALLWRTCWRTRRLRQCVTHSGIMSSKRPVDRPAAASEKPGSGLAHNRAICRTRLGQAITWPRTPSRQGERGVNHEASREFITAGDRIHCHSRTLCRSGKNQPLNGRFSTLPTGRQAGGARPGRGCFACSAARIPAQARNPCAAGRNRPRGAKPHSNTCTASHAVPVAVLCCTVSPAVRIMSLTCGAKGTRTPDPPACKQRAARPPASIPAGHRP
jgi:hypothetical protein